MIKYTYYIALYLSAITPLALAQDLPQKLTIASWNIVWFGDGKNDCLLRGNHKKNPRQCHAAHIRDTQDYQRLRQYSERLNADIIALQEVENISAIWQVFPLHKWQAFISSRQVTDKWAQHTAVVVRSGIQVKRHQDYAALDTSSGHLRYGIDLTLKPDQGAKFRLLAIHLKSGCPSNTSDNRRACTKLFRQPQPLAAWIQARAKAGQPFIIAGDWNRHITAPGDKFWQAVQDDLPHPLPRLRFTAQNHSLCHGRKQPFIDHIVLGGIAADWFQQFREIIYTEHAAIRKKLSDHCPVVVNLAL